MAENLKRTDLINAIEETRKSFDTDNPTVPFIEGDGIGIDIWPAAKKVFDAVLSKKFKVNVNMYGFVYILADAKKLV